MANPWTFGRRGSCYTFCCPGLCLFLEPRTGSTKLCVLVSIGMTYVFVNGVFMIISHNQMVTSDVFLVGSFFFWQTSYFVCLWMLIVSTHSELLLRPSFASLPHREWRHHLLSKRLLFRRPPPLKPLIHSTQFSSAPPATFSVLPTLVILWPNMDLLASFTNKIGDTATTVVIFSPFLCCNTKTRKLPISRKAILEQLQMAICQWSCQRPCPADAPHWSVGTDHGRRGPSASVDFGSGTVCFESAFTGHCGRVT